MSGKGGFVAALILFVAAAPAQAGYYMVMDANGDVGYTDTPPDRRTKKVVVRYFKTNAQEPYSAPLSYRFSNSYDPIIAAAARVHGLDPLLVKSVIKVESDFNHRTVSSKGAKGLMQLMPQTAREMSVKNVFSPEDNIHGGARYLKLMLTKFSGDTRLALAAYNAGPTAVENYKGIPPYQETILYVAKVMNAYTYLSGDVRPRGSYSGNVQAKAKAKARAEVYKSKAAGGALAYSDKPGAGMLVMQD